MQRGVVGGGPVQQEGDAVLDGVHGGDGAKGVSWSEVR